MREILFRGKCEDTGKWYYGQYIHLHKTTYCIKEDYDRNHNNDIHQIVFEEMTDWNLPNRHLRVDVIPKTVGQFTGLTDKNNTKIFEGDIVKVTYIEKREYMGVKYDDEYDLIEQVCYSTEKACYMLCIKYDDITMFRPIHNFENLVNIKSIEVIGNIHDNPELLKEQENEKR